MFCILKANEEEMQQQRGISPQDVSESNGSLQQKTMKNRHFQSNFFVKCVCILFKSFVLVQTEQYIKIDDNAFLFDWDDDKFAFFTMKKAKHFSRVDEIFS